MHTCQSVEKGLYALESTAWEWLDRALDIATAVAKTKRDLKRGARGRLSSSADLRRQQEQCSFSHSLQRRFLRTRKFIKHCRQRNAPK